MNSYFNNKNNNNTIRCRIIMLGERLDMYSASPPPQPPTKSSPPGDAIMNF